MITTESQRVIGILKILISAALSVPAAIHAQDSQTTPPTPAAQSAQKPATTLWKRERLTGDWGGYRTRWKDRGVDLDFDVVQFDQGVAKGGVEQDNEYNGKLRTVSEFDFAKLSGWDNWRAELRTEFRFGGPLPRVGTVSPVNIAEVVPGDDGEVFAITAFNVTRLFPIDLKKGDLYSLSVGRFNTLDLVDEDFFGGSGITRFFNVSQNGPLTFVRELPLITNGAILAYVRRGEPFFIFMLLDPNDHSVTPGLSDLFADGVTFAPAINLSTQYGGKSGMHTIAAFVTTKQYTPFDAISQIILPGPPITPIEPKRGSWSIAYTFRQYLVERGKRDGWGVFLQGSVANPDTSPISQFLTVGLGGNGLFANRPNDEFGLAYAFTDVSSILKDNLDPVTIGRIRGEHQVEMFYNFRVSPWLWLTGDLQIIRPTRPNLADAIVPGARLEIRF
jgi:porin